MKDIVERAGKIALAITNTAHEAEYREQLSRDIIWVLRTLRDTTTLDELDHD